MFVFWEFGSDAYFRRNIRQVTMSTPTLSQIEALFDFLEEHRDLARGILRSVEGCVRSQQLWKNIRTTLNAMGGCIKTTKQWQKVWIDKKYLAKKAIVAARRSAQATGGGPSTAPQPTPGELRVLSIMGDGFGEPQTTARVPAFVEETQGLSMPNVSTMQPQHEDLPQSYDYLPEEKQLPTEPKSQPDLPQSQQVSQTCQEASVLKGTSHVQTPRTKRPRSIRRQIQEDGSVREKLFCLETARNEELAGIKTALLELRLAFVELIGLMRQIIERLPRND